MSFHFRALAPVAATHGVLDLARRRVLLVWLLGVAVLGAGGVLAWESGLIATVLHADPTGLVYVMLLLLALAVGDGARRAARLASMLDRVRSAELPPRRPGLAESAAPFLTEPSCARSSRTADTEHERRVRQGLEFGWFAADALISLGLLGTVIGFIMMLGPLAALNAQDPAVLQGAIVAMGRGMAVALYTTLVGLVGALILRAQGFLLDEAAEAVLRAVARLEPARASALLEADHAPAQ